MAFPTGWNRRCPLVIQHGQVTADQTAYPVLITNASGCLPAEMVTLSGSNAAQTDGGDIRFSSDLAGTTQLACEITAWTQNATAASAIAEIWVPVNVLTGSDVTIYVWYNAGGGVTQPAAGAAFGSQAVWDSNYSGVFHLQTIGTNTTGTTADSTSNANNLTNAGSSNVTAVAGAFTSGGNGSSHNGDNYFLRKTGATGNPTGTTTYTLEGWLKRAANNSAQEIFGFGGNIAFGGRTSVFWDNTTTFKNECHNPGGTTTPSFPWTADTNWHQVIWALPSGTDTSTLLGYLDGASQTVTSGTPVTINNESPGGIFISAIVGAAPNLGFFGTVDEVRVSKIARSSSWIATQYNNHNAPGSFTVAGTPTSTGGGGGILSNPFAGVNPLQGYIL